ncbi:hypothetical protein RD110_13670 [Rhodoferax koreense]|uniref:LysM domain-containing protein n=1 Tax=Rhodoferax koreensis TaxID=1842727 RepID=A0A1P8JWI6_9BURK|nr:FecR domain-containing protein [Rhodoferax koreense]APW38115.1 hypothetical protein RD110_13670 [Rhodoferax koreense]
MAKHGLLGHWSRLPCWLVFCLLSSFLCNNVSAADFIYTVQPGDHPWNLAQRYLRHMALGAPLLALNHIPDDRRILPGTRLRIPQAWLKLETAQVRLLAAYGATSVQSGGNAAEHPAEPGAMLRAPARLRTGADGSATLQFADGSRVLMRRDSELLLRQTQASALGQTSLISIELMRGSLENQVTPLGNTGGRFEIRTPAATAAVRGTAFRLSFDSAAGVLRTEVLEGAVNVANRTGEATPQALQGNVSRTGAAPAPPVALLAAPNLDGLPARIERLPVDLPVAPLAGAVAYRTQVAPDARFEVVTSDETTLAARVRARELEDGSHVLRVRAIDAQGLEGLSAERALQVHARPAPPLLIEPAPDAVLTTARPRFRWTEGDPRLSYRLQLAAGDGAPAFVEPVDAQDVPRGTAQAGLDLPVGAYRWRVAAVDPQKGQGPWGDAQAFRRVLPGPDVAIAPVEEGRLILRWSAQPQAARYRFQIAREAAFGAPILDAETETPQYALQDLAPGIYQVRVQAIGADGFAGPWGAPQTFTVPEAPSPYWRALWLLIPALLMF